MNADQLGGYLRELRHLDNQLSAIARELRDKVQKIDIEMRRSEQSAHSVEVVPQAAPSPGQTVTIDGVKFTIRFHRDRAADERRRKMAHETGYGGPWRRLEADRRGNSPHEIGAGR